MNPKVALIVGGSIGAEIVPPVLDVLSAAGARIDWQRVDVPAATEDSNLQELLGEALTAVRDCRLALKTRLIGPKPHELATDNNAPGPMNPNVNLRMELGLFAAVRPIRTMPGLFTRYPDLDLILVRENTEDIYKGLEHEIVPGVVESVKVVTREACDRVARYAFEMAHEYGRSKITFIHKANIMKKADGLFMRTVQAVADENPDIEFKTMIVDACCMQMVLNPYQFDIMLMGNLYGDILSNLGTGLAGGISIGHSIGIGEDDLRVFEAIHGDAPHLVGTGKANPLPLLTPAVELLRHLGLEESAERVLAAAGQVLEAGRDVTPDLGGEASTTEMCRAIVDAL